MMVAVESAFGLVGREPELQAVHASVEDLTRGRGRLLLITGEPGMGKSALLRIAVDLATERGVASFTASCAPEPGAPPLWCWTQLFQGLRSERTALDPWLVAHLLDPAGDSAPNVDGPSSGFRLYEAVAGALLARADIGPVLLAIDDLQWADAESLAMFGFLARRLATAAILMLGAYRDAEAGPELQAIAGRAEVQTLLGMDDAAVGRLMAQIQGTRPDPTLAAAVRIRADGNPFFVRELTRLAMARGGWSADAGPVDGAVPDSIAATLRERLARLSTRSRRLLEMAALIGQESSTDVLAEALDDPADEVVVAAEEAVLARVLRPSADATRWAFVHDLYRSVLTSGLQPARRAVLHGAIGEALERRGSQGSERVPAGRLAAHFLASGRSGRAKASEYARLAAAEATQRFGHRETVRYLELALELDDDDDPISRQELLLDLGAARHRSGDRDGAADCFRQVAASAGEPLVLARAALGLAALEVRSGTPVDTNVALLRRAVAAVQQRGDRERPADGLLSRLYAALARELVHADLDGAGSSADEPVLAAQQAIVLAEHAADLRARATALLARHDAVWRPGTAALRLPLIADLITAAAAADDPDLVAEGLMLRSAALLETGDSDGIGELRRFVEHAEQLGHAHGHWAALSRRATIAVVSGDLDRAAALAAEALEFGREIGVPDAYGCYGTTMISLVAQGMRAEVPSPPEDDPIASMIPLAAAISHPEIDHGAEVRSVPLAALAKSYDLEALVVAAPVFARWGTDEQRRGIEAALRPYAGTHAVVGGCAAYYGPVDYYLGVVADSLGDHSRAREHLRTAAEQARRLGAGGWADLAAHHQAAGEDPAPSATWIKQGATWRLRFAGTEAHLPDLKGLRDIATLLAAQGHDVHVYTLLGRHEPALGADPVLDDESRRRYRRRIETLHADIERADEDGDVATSQAATLELDALVHELSVTTGLRGRRRRLGDEVDRARKTVSARIHDSLERVAQVHPTLGAHLTASLTVGVRCAYRPPEPVDWQLNEP